MKTNTLAVLLTLTGCALATSAHAILVPYTVSDAAPVQLAAPDAPPADAVLGPNGYPGDTVSLQAYTGTFDLTVGTSTQKINSLLWTIDHTWQGTDDNHWDVLSPFTLSRQIQIGTETALLTQTGLLTANWDNDYLSLNAGSTVTIDTQGYRIDITPLATLYGADGGGTNFDGDSPWIQSAQDIYAQFVVTEDSGIVAAPEPGSIAALAGLAALSLGSSTISRARSQKIHRAA